MCIFITIALPKVEAEATIRTLPRALHSFITDNTSITKHLPSDYITYCITSDGCSCNLFYSMDPDNDDEKEALTRKYKRKGWSEHKIQRALSEYEVNNQKYQKTYGFRKDLLEWLISVAHNTTGKLHIIVHIYSRDVETENFQIQHANVGIDNFYSYQETLPKDTLVKIHI